MRTFKLLNLSQFVPAAAEIDAGNGHNAGIINVWMDGLHKGIHF